MWSVLILLGLMIAVGTAAALIHSLRQESSDQRDPFTVGEPWRQFVQSATRSGTKLQQTIETAEPGPLRDRMSAVATRLDDGMRETWKIAQRGDQIDNAIRRLDPVRLGDKLASLETQAMSEANVELDAAVASVRSQLESVERLERESKKTADRLRLTQTRLDELVSRAAEVAIGAGDTDAYEHDVDDLVIELEALRQAVDETNRP